MSNTPVCWPRRTPLSRITPRQRGSSAENRMETTADSSPRDRFPLARVLILILAGAFVGLMADIRMEHVEVVHDHTIAWVPIVYSAFMTLACAVAFIFWNKTARRIM